MAEFSNEIFVGRAEQLVLFDRALTAKRPPFLILAISGQGGVGKSTLLEQFQHRAAEQDAVTVLVNEDDLTIPAILERFAAQLAEAGQECTKFKEQYQRYRALQEEKKKLKQTQTPPEECSSLCYAARPRLS